MVNKRSAYTRAELLALIMIFSIVTLVAIAIPRMSRNSAAARNRTCQTNIAMINTQIEICFSVNNTWPAALTDITNDPNYFPKGAPVCPAGGYYSIDDNTHRVSCSIHGR